MNPNKIAKLIQRVRRLGTRARELTAARKESRFGGAAPIADLWDDIHALEAAADDVEGVSAGPERKPYKTDTRKGPGNQNETTEEHESFGMLSFCRSSGQAQLFGSHLESHQHFITMRLFRGKVIHSLSRDWYHPESFSPVVEVWMSAAQFAEAITSMNHGTGVPCTLRSIEGVKLDEVPESVVAENIKIRENFKQDIEEVTAAVQVLYEQLDKLVETGSSVSKARAREMRDAIGAYLNRIDRDAGFVVSQFQESAEKVVQQAKTEVESFTNLALQRAGVAHLSQLADGQKPALSQVDRDGRCTNCGTAIFDDELSDGDGRCELCAKEFREEAAEEALGAKRKTRKGKA